MSKPKLMVYLSEEQYEALRRLAYEEHRSMAEIVREALDAHLAARGVRTCEREAREEGKARGG